MTVTPGTPSGSNVPITVELDVRLNYGAPVFDIPDQSNRRKMIYITIAHDLNGDFEQSTSGMGAGQFSTLHPTTFLLGGAPFPGPPSSDTPWVYPDIITGHAQFDFTMHGFSSGDRVRVAVLGVLDESGDTWRFPEHAGVSGTVHASLPGGRPHADDHHSVGTRQSITRGAQTPDGLRAPRRNCPRRSRRRFSSAS